MRKQFIKTCVICNKEYSSPRDSSKYCSIKCNGKSQKGKKTPHSKEWEEKRLKAVRNTNTNRVYAKGYKRPIEQVQPMLDELKKWQLKNPEKKRQQEINNLPKDTNGEKNGNWKNGISKSNKEYRIQNSKQYYNWRKVCLKRDGYKCKLCGTTENLQVHHIIPISESKRTAWLRMNGVTLCKKCHKENDVCWAHGHRFKAPENLGNTFVIGKCIRSEFQEYPTCGNYQETEDGLMVIFITEQKYQEYVNLIFMHELIEMSLCKIRGISEEIISQFDIKWNKRLIAGEEGLASEPGAEITAPYHKEHMFAEAIERQMAEKLGISWEQYENDLII